MSGPELLEIVELADGEVVLRRADSTGGSGEPLVSIRFSGEAREFLGEHAGRLGKSMIAAGLQMVGAMMGPDTAEGDSSEAVSPDEVTEGGAEEAIEEEAAASVVAAVKGRLH